MRSTPVNHTATPMTPNSYKSRKFNPNGKNSLNKMKIDRKMLMDRHRKNPHIKSNNKELTEFINGAVSMCSLSSARCSQALKILSSSLLIYSNTRLPASCSYP